MNMRSASFLPEITITVKISGEEIWYPRNSYYQSQVYISIENFVLKFTFYRKLLKKGTLDI